MSMIGLKLTGKIIMNKYQKAFNTFEDRILPVHYYTTKDDWKNIHIVKEACDKAAKYDEKETPKKPITIKPSGESVFDYPTYRIKCASCGHQLPMKKNCVNKKPPILYCDRCGQRIEWEE